MQNVGEFPLLTVNDNFDRVDECAVQSSTSPKNTGVRRSLVENRLPFGRQDFLRGISRQPVHMIQQDEPRNGLILLFEKSLNRVGMRRDPIGHACFQPIKVFWLEIFRAGFR